MNSDYDTERLLRVGLDGADVLPLIHHVHLLDDQHPVVDPLMEYLGSPLKVIFPTVRRSKVVPLDTYQEIRAACKRKWEVLENRQRIYIKTK